MAKGALLTAKQLIEAANSDTKIWVEYHEDNPDDAHRNYEGPAEAVVAYSGDINVTGEHNGMFVDQDIEIKNYAPDEVIAEDGDSWTLALYAVTEDK